MLVVDRVVLPALDQPEQVRELQRDQPAVLDQRAQPGGEPADVRDVGEHVVSGHQVSLAEPARELGPGFRAEEPDLGPDPLGLGGRGHVRGGLDPEHRDAGRHEVLQQVTVVAGHLGDQAVRGQPQRADHRVGVPLGMRDPGVGVGREVGVVGEDVLPRHVRGQLHEQARLADQHVQRVEDLRVIQACRRDVALTERGHPEIDE